MTSSMGLGTFYFRPVMGFFFFGKRPVMGLIIICIEEFYGRISGTCPQPVGCLGSLPGISILSDGLMKNLEVQFQGLGGLLNLMVVFKMQG